MTRMKDRVYSGSGGKEAREDELAVKEQDGTHWGHVTGPS